MFENKGLTRWFMIGGISFWILLIIITSFETLENPDNLVESSSSIRIVLKDIFMCLFFLCIFLYYKAKNLKQSSYNFSELIWQAFVTGALMLFALLLTRQMTISSDETGFMHDHFWLNLVYNINIVFITIFVSKVFYVFKQMILYHRSKGLLKAWYIYEYTIITSILFNIKPFDLSNNYPILIFIGIVSLFGLVLALNMRWVAYLNFKQKWNNLLLISLIILISISVLYHIFTISSPKDNYIEVILNDLRKSVFIISTFSFIFFYCLSSMLVIIFNFPTSSVFEQKLGEVFNFRRLSQTIQRVDEEEQIYDILLETCASTVMASAAWLEIIDKKDEYSAFLNKNIDKYDIFEVKKVFKRNKLPFNEEAVYIKNIKKLKNAEIIQNLSYRSVLIVPLYAHSKFIGLIGLIRNVSDGFNKELIEITKSFASQATISIENSRLVAEAIEHERYKEEIKIAKAVQKSLIPNETVFNSEFQISAFTQSADEIGGDYYDTFKIDENRTTVVIADVSGHGTTAAFNMAQLKGVLQSLMLIDMPMTKILTLANQALGNCLKKKTFITLTLYTINTKTKTFSILRAGHCPTLYYDNSNDSIQYLKHKGLGLGILKGNDFGNHIDEYTKQYNSGDILVLYTDGIVEAKNTFGEEYGYDRLLENVKKNTKADTTKIIEELTEDLYSFSGKKKLSDDYTCLTVKFI